MVCVSAATRKICAATMQRWERFVVPCSEILILAFLVHISPPEDVFLPPQARSSSTLSSRNRRLLIIMAFVMTSSATLVARAPARTVAPSASAAPQVCRAVIWLVMNRPYSDTCIYIILPCIVQAASFVGFKPASTMRIGQSASSRSDAFARLHSPATRVNSISCPASPLPIGSDHVF